METAVAGYNLPSSHFRSKCMTKGKVCDHFFKHIFSIFNSHNV